MTITMIRHGLTQGNIERRYVGATDVPLAPQGEAQARAARKDTELRKVYVTPLARAWQTAAILYPHADQHVTEGLREMDFGVFEGRTYEELEQDPAFQLWSQDGGMQPMERGEGRYGFGVRVRDALADLISQAHARGEDSITVVAHGGTIMALMAMHALPEKSYNEWWVENLQGYRVRLDPAAWGPDAKFTAHEAVDLNEGD